MQNFCIVPSFGVLGGVRFMNVAFSGRLHLYLFAINKF